jgi:TRAP-type mannitol/chloroaromatic compound transport system permease large subunit
MREEMTSHIEQSTERLMARGMSRAEAERLARREFGPADQLDEEARDARGGRWVETTAADVIGAALAAAARGQLSWSMIQASLRQTMVTVGTIIWLILGAVSLVGIYNIIGGNSYMQELLSGLDLPPLGVILVMMGILVVLGTFMEWIAIVFITVPIFAPVVTALGFDPIWFGVLFVMNMQVYFLSPPFGPACFWLKSVAPPDVTLQEIFASVWPFIGLQLVGLFLVMFFPQIALWLPSVVFG